MIRLLAFLIVLAANVQAQDAALEHFEKKIRPVLVSRCYACHSNTAPKVQGGLLLDSKQGLERAGNSGQLIDRAQPANSLLLRALRHTDANLKMPPGKPLPPEIIADFEAWVAAGAPMPDIAAVSAVRKSERALWSLQKPAAVAEPAVQNRDWAKTGIDRFILQKLEQKNLMPSAEADKRTLIRRAYYGVTGLPPSAAETAAFVKDNSPDAYEKLVDRLLASPHYGERWARHWLDVARYSDSVNDSVNSGQRFPWSYTYRDWVIQSLNEDLPYDKFLLYQLAADRIPDLERRHLAALGYLSLGRNFPKSYPETVDDRIDAVTRGMLGLTVSCARCHDHKYDPIPTKDYYSLYSVFSNIRTPADLPLLQPVAAKSAKDSMYQDRLALIRQADREYRARRNGEMVAFFKTQTAEYLIAARDAAKLSNTEIEELVRDRQLNLHVLSRWRKALDRSRAADDPVFRIWHRASAIADKAFAVEWPKVVGTIPPGNSLIEEAIRKEKLTTLAEVAEAYSKVLQRYDRAEPFTQTAEEQLRAVMRGTTSPADVPVEEFEQIYSEGDGNNTRSIRVRYNAMLAQYAYDGAPARAMAVEDVPDPAPAHVFVRGNPNNPGAETPPHFLTCIPEINQNTFEDGSGRLDLARAIIDRDNPLTARVIVNRVWMHHFGSGLVTTPSDFGFRGEAPTHPELLDYLALKFVESGWSLKKLHRMILMSAVYRQASGDNEAARKLDPENRLLWRMNRRRLEIESLRDSMLLAAGRLDRTEGGVPFSLTAEPSVPRRTVYGFIERGRIPAMLSAFDFASPDQHAPLRHTTTVPQQALFFLNSPFVAEQARALAHRKEVASVSDAQRRIEKLYEFTLGRTPKPTEIAAGLKFVAAGSDASHDEPDNSPWQYGIGEYDSAKSRIQSFTEFGTYAAERWQGAAALPVPTFGKAWLRATGGEPGELANQAVVRRWISPDAGKIAIEGTLRHGQGAVPYGDGVRGRIVSSRMGELASWSVNGSSAETKLTGIAVEKGDTIDFVVDARSDVENDVFTWTPSVTIAGKTWNAKNDFAGPAPKKLDVWSQYAQVLLQTNEFSFVD